MKLSEKQKNKLMQIVSGSYLTEDYPDGFQDLDDKHLMYFIQENTWVTFENVGAREIKNVIQSAYEDIIAFIEEL